MSGPGPAPDGMVPTQGQVHEQGLLRPSRSMSGATFFCFSQGPGPVHAGPTKFQKVLECHTQASALNLAGVGREAKGKM